LSSEFSLAPNAKKGGEIGYVSRGELHPDAAVFLDAALR